MESKEFRFYENLFPEIDDLVMGQVSEVEETHAVVELLEYGRREAMISATEFTRTRRGNIQKKIMQLKKMRKVDAYLVTNVDQEKGYIDLSKKKVGNLDVTEVEERYEKGKGFMWVDLFRQEGELDDVWTRQTVEYES
jgi:translation initiation factor 2 subunit 1